MDMRVEKAGAKGDGATDDTESIQAAIDRSCLAGGGRVTFSSGKTYLCSSLVLKSNVELYFEKEAILKANTDFNQFIRPAKLKYSGKRKTAFQKPAIVWLYAYDQDHIAITGDGLLEGNADSVTRRVNPYYVAGNGLPRPTMIYFEKCRDVAVRGVSIRKAPFWTLHLAGCTEANIVGIQIRNDLDCANSDGIDPDHCKNVLIENCRIECADDCVAIKNTKGNMEYGDSENITIRNCELMSTSAAIKIGTESMNDFKNITVENCNISKSNRGVSLQLRDNGNIEDATFSNIKIETRRFSKEWWGSGEPVAITVLPRHPFVKCGSVRNIKFSGITCDSENGIIIYAGRNKHIKDIFFDNVTIVLSIKSKWYDTSYDLRPGFLTGIIRRNTRALFVNNAENVITSNVIIKDFIAPQSN